MILLVSFLKIDCLCSTSLFHFCVFFCPFFLFIFLLTAPIDPSIPPHTNPLICFFASISLSPASDIPQPEFLLFLYPFHFSLSLNLHLVLDQRSIANILFQVHFIYFSHLFNCVFFFFFVFFI